MSLGARREIGGLQALPTLWSVLFSATVIGLMIATEIGRIYRSQSPQAAPSPTGAFGATQGSDESRAVQHQRAHEPGRGRHAETPWHIPWKGWKDILWRTYEQVGENRLLAVAAGVVFYGLLAVFPAVTALVSLYGLFASPSHINEHLSLVAGILPQGAVDILREQIGRLTTGNSAKLSAGLFLDLPSRYGALTPA
jgi:membrane protein